MISVLVLAILTGITYIGMDELTHLNGNPIVYSALSLALALLFDIRERLTK